MCIWYILILNILKHSTYNLKTNFLYYMVVNRNLRGNTVQRWSKNINDMTQTIFEDHGKIKIIIAFCLRKIGNMAEKKEWNYTS